MKGVSERRLKKAQNMYETFQTKVPQKADLVKINVPEHVGKVGKADNIIYRSGKWEKGRKTNDYIHVFDSMPPVYHQDGTSTKKKVSSLIGPWQTEQIPLAFAGTCLEFHYVDLQGELQELFFPSYTKLLITPNGKTLVILTKDPIFVSGNSMRVEARGIVK